MFLKCQDFLHILYIIAEFFFRNEINTHHKGLAFLAVIDNNESVGSVHDSLHYGSKAL